MAYLSNFPTQWCDMGLPHLNVPSTPAAAKLMTSPSHSSLRCVSLDAQIIRGGLCFCKLGGRTKESELSPASPEV